MCVYADYLNYIYLNKNKIIKITNLEVSIVARNSMNFNLVCHTGISLAVKPEIMGVAGANMQWGHFVCPSSSQKRESTAFDLILQSTWELSSPSKQVGRSSTPCWKRSQVWGRESEQWPKYMQ